MKKLLCLLFALCLVLSCSPFVFAENLGTVKIGRVWFTSDGTQMKNDFQYLTTTDETSMKARKTNPTLSDVLNDRITTLQPGDEVTFYVELTNEYTRGTNWYMTSEVIDSLESGTAQNGAYEYELWYVKNSTGARQTLFSSKGLVGQQSGENGLEQVNSALKTDYTHNGQRYFYLDNLSRGQGGTIYLKIELDGETQGNDYQDRMADIKMNFAVQIEDVGTTTTSNAPKTGDDTNLLPYYVAMIISGLLFLYFALDSYTDRLYKKGGARK